MGRSSLAVTAAFATVGLAACGDDQQAKKTETVKLELVGASFAPLQKLAKEETMRITVRNPTSKTIEQVTATVSPGDTAGTGSGFDTRSADPGVADPSRPIWVVDEAPKNGVTADPAVTRLGPIAAGKSASFTWKLMPVRPGTYKLRWTVGGNLTNQVRVTDQQGDPISGTFPVRISDR